MIFPEAWMEKKMVDHPGTTPVRPEVSSDAGWRTIDSAPKDGTVFFAYWHNIPMFVCWVDWPDERIVTKEGPF